METNLTFSDFVPSLKEIADARRQANGKKGPASFMDRVKELPNVISHINKDDRSWALQSSLMLLGQDVAWGLSGMSLGSYGGPIGIAVGGVAGVTGGAVLGVKMSKAGPLQEIFQTAKINELKRIQDSNLQSAKQTTSNREGK